MRGLDYNIKQKLFDDYNNKKSHIITTNSGKRKRKHSVSALAQHYDVSVSTCYSVIHEMQNEGKEVNWRRNTYDTLDDIVDNRVAACAIEKDEFVKYDDSTENDIPKLEDSSLVDTFKIGKDEIGEVIEKKIYPQHESSVDYSPIAEEKVKEIVVDMDETTNLIRKKDNILDKYKDQFTINSEKEKYNNQSIVLYKATPFINEEQRNYIKDKVNIDDITLDSALNTPNKNSEDFTLENRVTDTLIDLGIIAINETSNNPVDERKSNQAAVLHACERYLSTSKNDASIIEYVKGIIRTELKLISNVDVEDKYKEIFSSEYKTDDNFKTANSIYEKMNKRLPSVFQGTKSTALLSYDVREKEKTVFEEIRDFQNATTEGMTQEEMGLTEKIILTPVKKEKPNYMARTDTAMPQINVKDYIDTDSDLVQKGNRERTDKFKKMLGPNAKNKLIEKFGNENKRKRQTLAEKTLGVASVASIGAAFLNYIF